MPESRNTLQNLETIFSYDALTRIYLKAAELEVGTPYRIFTKQTIVIKTK